jgi:hypothetical protein
MGSGWKGRTCWAVIRVASIIGLKEFSSCRQARGQVSELQGGLVTTYRPIFGDCIRGLRLAVDWVLMLPFCVMVGGGEEPQLIRNRQSSPKKKDDDGSDRWVLRRYGVHGNWHP